MSTEEELAGKKKFVEDVWNVLEVLEADERRVAWMLAMRKAAKICERRGSAGVALELLDLSRGDWRESAMKEAYAGEQQINGAYKAAKESLLLGLEELGAPARPV